MPDGNAERVAIYTDGGCDPNPGPGGWAAILQAGGHEREISGGAADTTNNRMELVAAISALRLLKRPCNVALYTDSQYLRRGVTEWMPQWAQKGWRKADGEPVKNQDLWRELDSLIGKQEIAWHWVKGHRGNRLNERADRLATEARRRVLAEARSGDLAPSSASERKELLPKVVVVARGSALGSPGPGGYAAIIVGIGDDVEVSGSWPIATNNAMELWAVVAGLRSLESRSRVTVYTRSKYAFDGATRWLPRWERRGWRTREGRPVKNREIWIELTHVTGDHDVTWRTEVPDTLAPYGERAANLARAAAKKQEAADRSTTGDAGSRS